MKNNREFLKNTVSHLVVANSTMLLLYNENQSLKKKIKSLSEENKHLKSIVDNLNRRKND